MQIDLEITISKVSGFHQLVFMSDNGPMTPKNTSNTRTVFSSVVTDNGACPHVYLNASPTPLTPKDKLKHKSSEFTGSGSSNSTYINNGYYYAGNVMGHRSNPYPWITPNQNFTGVWKVKLSNPNFFGHNLRFAFVSPEVATHGNNVWCHNNSTISIKISSNGNVIHDYVGNIETDMEVISDPDDEWWLDFKKPANIMKYIYYTPIFLLSDTLIDPSSYIRLNAKNTLQTVTTPLDFRNDITVKDPKTSNEIVNKRTLDKYISTSQILRRFI